MSNRYLEDIKEEIESFKKEWFHDKEHLDHLIEWIKIIEIIDNTK